MNSNSSAWMVTLSYVVVAIGWVLFSDSLLMMADAESQQRLQSIKGVAFVLATGGLLFFSVRYHLRRRRQQEEALKRSQERFNLALIGGNDGLWDWDISSGEMYLSLRGRQILGLNQQGPLSNDWLALLHPEDREPARLALVRHLRGDTERLDLSYRVRQPDGRTIWIEAAGRAVRNNDGRVTRMVGMLRDVSEQIEREQRLRQAGVMFDCTSEGMLICDVDQTILDVNNAFCKITGYEPGEVIGRQPRILASGRHDRTFYRQLWQQLHATGRWSGEVWNRRKNGEVYPQWQNIISVKDHHGELSHYVAVFADMSVIKRNQQEIDYLAHHDPLTKLPNRLLLNERLSTAIARARRQQSGLGLLFIDLDRFKGVNASVGVGLDTGQRRQSECFCLGSGTEPDDGGAIVDGGRIASGHGAIFLEGGDEPISDVGDVDAAFQSAAVTLDEVYRTASQTFDAALKRTRVTTSSASVATL